MKNRKEPQIPQVDLHNRSRTASKIANIRNGVLRDRIQAFDDAIVPRYMADFILQSFKIGGISPRLKPTTSPFNFNLPDPLRDYLEYRCSTTFSNMTKYLIDMIQSDMDNLPITGKETPLADLCDKDPELAAKVIRFTIAQFDRLGCIETVAVHKNTSPVARVHKDGHIKYEPYNDPYGDLANAIRNMAKNNEAGAEFDSVVCHPDLEKFVRECIKGTPWEAARIIRMKEDILRYNIIFLKKYRTEIFALKKSDALMEEKTDDHGEYFYDEESLKSWFKSIEETESKAKDRYRIIESVKANGESSFSIEEHNGLMWSWNGMTADSLEKAKDLIESIKKNEVIKKVVHEV